MTERPPTDWRIEQQDSAPPDWADFIAACPDSHFFATPLWTRAICRYWSGTTPIWLTARRDRQLVAGMVALHLRRGPFGRLVSHFEGTQGGPLVAADLLSPQQDSLFQDLVQAYAALRRGATLEATLTLGAGREARFGALLPQKAWQRREVPTAVMPLAGGLKHVEMHVLKKNRRNERNRSLKRGCRYEVTADPEKLAAYYPIYRAAAQRWQITPVPQSLLHQLLVEGEGRVFLTLVSLQEQVIGGHLNVHWGDRVTAWNGATLPEHDDNFPATLLIWADLEEACRRGARWLDLGGSGRRRKLADFKRLLGAKVEVSAHYQLETDLVRIWRRSRAWFRNLHQQGSAVNS